jgi:hypothetical protein
VTSSAVPPKLSLHGYSSQNKAYGLCLNEDSFAEGKWCPTKLLRDHFSFSILKLQDLLLSPHFTFTSSTSNTRVEFCGIGPILLFPYPIDGGIVSLLLSPTRIPTKHTRSHMRISRWPLVAFEYTCSTTQQLCVGLQRCKVIYH